MRLISEKRVLERCRMIDMIKENGKKFSELTEGNIIYQQVLQNVPVEKKNEVQHDYSMKAAIEEAEQALGDQGRVLVRPSGTESLVRVMVEAETKELCEKHAEQIIQVVKQIG